MDRRAFLISAGCLASAAGATVLRPRERVSLIGSLKLETAIPDHFAGWSRFESNQIVAPESENSLSRQLYSQSIARLYARGDEEFAMLLIAYGDTQSDTLQLHRPEVCYPAFGMEITDNRPVQIAVAPQISIPGRELVAMNAERQEFITYWTRIGQALPMSGSEQRAAKLRNAMAGIIPDGVLTRVSTLANDPAKAFASNQQFIADLLAGLRPAVRRVLTGDAIALALNAAPTRPAG